MLLHSSHRKSRAMTYVVLMAAGAASFTSLNVTFYQSVALRVLGVFLIVGGLISLVGHVKKETHIEIIGCPTLIAAMAALSASAFITHGTADPARWMMGLLLTSFTLSLASRYRDLQALISLGEHMKESE